MPARGPARTRRAPAPLARSAASSWARLRARGATAAPALARSWASDLRPVAHLRQRAVIGEVEMQRRDARRSPRGRPPMSVPSSASHFAARRRRSSSALRPRGSACSTILLEVDAMPQPRQPDARAAAAAGTLTLSSVLARQPFHQHAHRHQARHAAGRRRSRRRPSATRRSTARPAACPPWRPTTVPE